MALIAKEPESKFVLAPEGLQQAVCCDVQDLGMEQNSYGKMQHKVRIVWQTEHQAEEYKRPHEVSAKYSLSLHERSMLRKHLEAWRGRKFTDQELKGFDLENLIGVNCQLQVSHSLSQNGKTYANVGAIVPLGKNMAKMAVSSGYTRLKDRLGQANGSPSNEPIDLGEEEIPF